MARGFLATFPTPGVNIALIGPAMPDLASSCGVLQLVQPAGVEAHSRFAIASSTKAFTAATLELNRIRSDIVP